MHDEHSNKTVEAWAERKGMLPQWTAVPTRVGRHETTTQRLNPKYVQFAMAKAHARWPEGKEVSEEQFDEAVATASGLELK